MNTNPINLNDMRYPVHDGLRGQGIVTDGMGHLSFDWLGVTPKYVYFVDKNGSDIYENEFNAGSFSKPFLTLQKAVDTINALNDPLNWYMIYVGLENFGDIDLSQSQLYMLVIRSISNQEHPSLSTTINNFTCLANNTNLQYLYIDGINIETVTLVGDPGSNFGSGEVGFVNCNLNTVSATAVNTLTFNNCLTTASSTLNAINCGSCNLLYSDGSFNTVDIINDGSYNVPNNFSGSSNVWQSIVAGQFNTTSVSNAPISIAAIGSSIFGYSGQGSNSIDQYTTLEDWGGNVYNNGLTNNSGTILTFGDFYDNVGTKLTATTIPTAITELDAERVRRVASAPSSSTSTGLIGDYFVDSTFAYFCIATNTWVKIAVIASF